MVIGENGKLFVKSCNEKIYQETTLLPPADTRMRNIYSRLWKLPTLPRIHQFMWKAISKLTKDVLGSAIVGDDVLCPLCELQTETAGHLIMHCNFSRAVWFAVIGWTSNNNGTLSEWTLSWFDSLHSRTIIENDLVKRAIIAWSIWTERCDKSFNGSNVGPEVIIQRCKNIIEEHSNMIANPLHITPRVNRQNVHWIHPPIYCLTTNCDGSFDSTNFLGDIGLIIRNSAVQWAKELKLERVHFEMDAKVVADAVDNDNSAIDWRLHHIVQDIKNLFSTFSSWKLSYVPKERSKVADMLAKMSRTNIISLSWGCSPPPVISNQVAVDCSHITNHRTGIKKLISSKGQQHPDRQERGNSWLIGSVNSVSAAAATSNNS
ncbi:uncharacterized protein LOC113305970 [Papaver somniferum]|uniref:uncharacterized protein LOC113305970 n=1 Tax=Papaver somniferum TaxID=3469 RepID=UPI000E6FE7AE|nr:uncharacterized protein LOC113305970 [Papaver somniferum]